MQEPVRIGFVKLGNIGTAPIVEFLLDERAERGDVSTRTVGAGSKIGTVEAEEVATKLLDFKPQAAIVLSPNAALPGPTKARQVLAEAGVPTIVVSDGPTKKVLKQLEDGGFGYIVVEGDAMIGARREFLDPVEMAIFNSDIIKVLSVTGALKAVTDEIDKVIDALKKGERPVLPRLVLDKERATEAAGFSNPYARAKAIAAYEVSRRVAAMTTEACFLVKDWERYTALAAAAHEAMRVASVLADEAREIEKACDSLLRSPHHDDGAVLSKRKLIEKPRRSEQPKGDVL
ncbi:MAG: F420-dependent methylenetetrahydromethanopterin dehydrogenase [Thermoproteota archaeon]